MVIMADEQSKDGLEQQEFSSLPTDTINGFW
jgi:hypothetical protein